MKNKNNSVQTAAVKSFSIRTLIMSFGMVLCVIFLTSCADAQPHLEICLQGHTYGFWGGFWHGLIVPFSWIGSLFSDNIAIWAVNNNGGWYNFGFVFGMGVLGSILKGIIF